MNYSARTYRKTIPATITKKFKILVLSKKLEPIPCRDWKQLLAASTEKSSDFKPQFAAPYCILEPPIAESANWKLNLADSAERRATASPSA
jgi:hypothetical protein